MNKKDFVENELSSLVRKAKSHLVRCEYIVEDVHDEYVIVHCENGYKYKICVTANSLIGIAEAVVTFVICK